jgi:adenylate kinase family enzyme
MASMRRIVVLGRGAAGKSEFSRSAGQATGIPWIELDRVFWSQDLRPLSTGEWHEVQARLVAADAWILDGDLGPYDAPEVRLALADAVVLFDVSLLVCAFRALRRSRERLDFWKWLVTWRRRYRPALLQAIRLSAPRAELFVVRSRRDRDRVLSRIVGRAREG